eukprot:gnl/MRDRNA2_/MRDRNA2_82317_c0_seq4.p1 gnl/MRDRNA2_/MRDRNA2_82317_c0~~gnl/MRDRNA2_/MRDRNA2_82317_c0_seq4.p1  ORF type:complete len:200 (+),score=43.23 gnl/MRDRNA2_/MRDRNA2_82317_c0_seq4:73-672(+)
MNTAICCTWYRSVAIIGAKSPADRPGGEFEVAMEAAKAIPSVQRIVLGDRDSVLTHRREAELLLRSDRAPDVMRLLMAAGKKEFDLLEDKVRQEMPGCSEARIQKAMTERLIEESLKAAMVKRIKSEPDLRIDILQEYGRETPEFLHAFIKERDYIMAEAILREQKRGAKHVVAVVGAGHLPGIVTNLEGNGLRIQESP